jgi:hypothetical protein
MQALSSPAGAKSCSQGREALVKIMIDVKAPTGRHRRVIGESMSPFRGFEFFADRTPGPDGPGYTMPPLRG